MARGIRIGRRVVKGRFIIILLILAGLLLWLCLPKGAGRQDRGTSAASGSMDTEVTGPALCIWPEEVYTAPLGQRVERHVADGAQVVTGDSIADILPAEGDSAVLDQFNALKEDISRYQMSILSAEQTGELATLNTEIDEAASAVQRAVRDGDVAAVAAAQAHLEAKMEERQQWLDEHVDPDEYLLGLYQQEAALTQDLAEEMVPIIAPADGYVSFSVDGWEDRLSPDLIDYITPADMEEWLGTQDQEDAGTAAPAADAPFFKIIYDQQWYLAVQTESAEGLYAGDSVSIHWNEGSGAVAAEVVRTAGGQGGDLIILRPNSAPVYPRYGYVRVVKTVTGVKVPANALYQENGRDYIRIDYNGTSTPIEVNVEAQGEEYAVVSAAGDVEGLLPGVTVYSRD